MKRLEKNRAARRAAQRKGMLIGAFAVGAASVLCGARVAPQDNEVSALTKAETVHINSEKSQETIAEIETVEAETTTNEINFESVNLFEEVSEDIEEVSTEYVEMEDIETVETVEVEAEVNTEVDIETVDAEVNAEVDAEVNAEVDAEVDAEVNAEVTYDSVINAIDEFFAEGQELKYNYYGGEVVFNKEGTNVIQQMIGNNIGRYQMKWDAVIGISNEDIAFLGCENNSIKIAVNKESVRRYAFFNLEHFAAAIENYDTARKLFEENEMEFASSIKLMREYVINNIFEESSFSINCSATENLKDMISPLIGDFNIEVEFVNFSEIF